MRPPIPFRTRPALLLTAAAICSGSALPAGAQFYERPGPPPYAYERPAPPYGYPAPEEMPERRLPPYEIVERLEARGYDDVGRPRFDGSAYVVEATSPAGVRERLTLDAVRGRVVGRVALADPRRRDVEDDDEDTSTFAYPGSGPRIGALPSPPRYGSPPESEDLPPAPGGPGRGSPAPREPGRPLDIGPVESRALPPPSDPRLSPSPDTRSAPPVEARIPDPTPSRIPDRVAPEPQREASRPAPSSSPPPSGVYGVNPGGGGDVKPRAPTAARAPRPTAPAPARTSPAAPVPEAKPDVAGRPADTAPATTADAAPRKPVRVIEGVTRMDGGAQNTPGPQNGVQGKP